jgi:hypothetical protein
VASQDTPAEEGFEYIGYYAPPDAEKLIEAFTQAGIEYRADVIDRTADAVTPLGHFGGTFSRSVEILISGSVDRREQIHEIHARLFGDCLPNFDSSFFKTHPPDESEPV